MSQIDTGNNKIKIMHGGKVVIIEPENKDYIVPLFCPLCLFPMKTLDDSITYKKHKCCFKCEMRWSSNPSGDWSNGWRPSENTDGWKEYLEERKLLGRPIFNLK
jgi:hypothetical protein